MKSKIELAFDALNEYDYKMGKSAQEGLWTIHQMEDIFSENKGDSNVSLRELTEEVEMYKEYLDREKNRTYFLESRIKSYQEALKDIIECSDIETAVQEIARNTLKQC